MSSLPVIAATDMATPGGASGMTTTVTGDNFAGLIDAALADDPTADAGSSDASEAVGEPSYDTVAPAANAFFSPILVTPAVVLAESAPVADEAPALEQSAGNLSSEQSSAEVMVNTPSLPTDTATGPSILPQAPVSEAGGPKIGNHPTPETPEVLPDIDAVPPALAATEGDTAIVAPSPAVMAAVVAQAGPRQDVQAAPPKRTSPPPVDKAGSKPRATAGDGPEVLYGPGGAGDISTDGTRPRPGLEVRLDGLAGRQAQIQTQAQTNAAALATALTEATINTPETPGVTPGQAENLPAADTAPVVAHEVLSGISHSAIQATAQIAAQIVRKLEGRSTRFEMALTPDDLGQVDVSISIDADGQLAARLAFDNPLAALDLRGRADELRRQLEEAGFRLAEDALQFAERDPSSRRDGTFDQRSRQAFVRSGRLAEDADIEISAPVAGRWMSLSLTPDRVDVKV